MSFNLISYRIQNIDVNINCDIILIEIRSHGYQDEVRNILETV